MAIKLKDLIMSHGPCSWGKYQVGAAVLTSVRLCVQKQRSVDSDKGLLLFALGHDR